MQDISVVKDAINSLVSGNRLVNGFRAKGIGIEKVSLTSFTFQSSIAPGGPALGVPLPPLVLPPRSSREDPPPPPSLFPCYDSMQRHGARLPAIVTWSNFLLKQFLPWTRFSPSRAPGKV